MPGEEARVSNLRQCSWSNIVWLCAHLGFVVHTLYHYCEMVRSYRCRKQGLQAFGGGLKGWKLMMVQHKYIPVVFLRLQLVYSLTLSPQVSIEEICWVHTALAVESEFSQLWSMESGLLWGSLWVVVWSFKSSSQVVAQQGLFDWVMHAGAHSPLATELRSTTLIISLCLASRVSLSSLFSSPSGWLIPTVQHFCSASLFSWARVATWTNVQCAWIMHK